MQSSSLCGIVRQWSLRGGLLCVVLLSCIAAAAESSQTVKFPLPAPSTVGAEEFSRQLNLFLTQGGFSAWQHEQKPHPTGPFIVHRNGEVQSFGTHGPSAVQVYFSPEVWTWLVNGSQGVIPDGGMIVKALFARNPTNPVEFSPTPTGFSIMVKDSLASWDGWFYSDGGPLQKPGKDCALTFFDPNAGAALSCMNCHASADNVESTFSSLRAVNGKAIEHSTTVFPDGLLKGLSREQDIHDMVVPAGPLPKITTKTVPWPYAKEGVIPSLAEPAPMTLASFDHLPQGPRPAGQRAFVTSSNCMACHDAVQLYSAMPNMILSEENKRGGHTLTNLSPYSEWRYSMMGLAGRDPVFLAQLESERLLYPALAENVDTACLSCHAPMGHRQAVADLGSEALYTQQMLQGQPGQLFEKYGALGRDGVSCVICHRMSPDGMGTPGTYTGRFKLTQNLAEMFGPYEKPVPLPMEHALGITPKHGPHMSDSKLCASCHTVALPSLEVGRKYTPTEFGATVAAFQNAPRHHEQTTYLEWKNSRFSSENPANAASARSCQDCHMPRTHKDQSLKFRVANIEDDTFPPVDHRAPDPQIHLEQRERYSRHALHGINVFTLEMFNQQPTLLGVQRADNLFPTPEAKSGFDVALDSMHDMAAHETARIEILAVKRTGQTLSASVKVSNLTGHKFPTGVFLRRAFIEFTVKDGNSTLWKSGATDAWGVLGVAGSAGFTPLQSEFFGRISHQPHYRTITREDQVQIYEQLNADSNGDLTTSFLRQHEVIKDNRLLPRGWLPTGPDAGLTRSVGTGASPDYEDGSGSDTLTYEIPLSVSPTKPLTVSAALYYQALPPYYLQQRFQTAAHPDSQRLMYLVQTLERERPGLKEWKLQISRTERSTP